MATKFTYTVKAGQVVADSQEMADRIAKSLACDYARAEIVCVTTPVPPGGGGGGGGGGGAKTGGGVPHARPPEPPKPADGAGSLGNRLWICAGEKIDDTEPWFQANQYGNLVDFDIDPAAPLPPGGFKMTINSGSIPDGVDFIQIGPNGAGFRGTMDTPGKFFFTIKVERGGGLGESLVDYEIDVFGITNGDIDENGNIVLDSAGACSSLSIQLDTDGGTAPVSFSNESAAKFPWLSISSTGLITGNIPPSVQGTDVAFDVSITDAEGAVCLQSMILPVSTLVCNTLANPSNGVENVVYSFAYSASFGVGPYTYTLFSGTIPAGLVLHTTGVIDGTPQAGSHGSYGQTIIATDSRGCSCSSDTHFDIGTLGNTAQTARCPSNTSITNTVAANTVVNTGAYAGYNQGQLDSVAMSIAAQGLIGCGCTPVITNGGIGRPTGANPVTSTTTFPCSQTYQLWTDAAATAPMNYPGGVNTNHIFIGAGTNWNLALDYYNFTGHYGGQTIWITQSGSSVVLFSVYIEAPI